MICPAVTHDPVVPVAPVQNVGFGRTPDHVFAVQAIHPY
jgi:hypothetical protein